jgi:pimeloyl-ACP methyl ester carboxylesterase
MRKLVTIKVLRVLILIGGALSMLNFYSCSHIPKNQISKQKIILVHGFGRSTLAMSKFEEFFEQEGYQVYSIGYRSLTQDIDGIKKEFFNKVNKHLVGVDQTVHFVGHSMGGLMIRSYLDQHKVKNLGNVVILGSPNKGTPLVEYVEDKWYYSLAGPALKSLSSKGSAFLRSLKKPYYTLGVIAGYRSGRQGGEIIPGKDDGIVPFESTKVEGMKDFLPVAESHYSMRYSFRVMKQVQYFLDHGQFYCFNG